MRHRPHRLTRLLATLAGAALAASASAQVQFTYQGQLTNEGIPANGVYDFIFILQSQPEGEGEILAPPICSPGVQVTNGFFSVSLDFEGVYNPGSTYLEIQVGPPSDFPCDGPEGTYTTLSPRQPVTPSAYSSDSARFGGQDPAFYLNASNLTGTVPSNGLEGTYSGSINLSNLANFFAGNGGGLTNLNASRFTIGTFPDARLSTNVDLLGSAQTFSAVKTFSAAPSFTAATPFTVTGTGLVTNLNADKLDGLNSSQFVRTDAASTITGPANATALTINANSFPALDINSDGPTTAARIDRGANASGEALRIQTAGSTDFGLYITQTSTTAAENCIYARQAAPDGMVLSAINAATTGAAIAVFGQSASSSGAGGEFIGGVGLRATGSADDGIVARTNVTSHSGLYGVNDVLTGSGYGVFGQCNSSLGYGLFARGRSGASGTKSFRIDHPADPTGKYLLHYSAESPEVLNLYRGTITLDNAGEATVLLPDYFAAINADPSYQLTAVGSAMPGLFVSREVDGAALAAGAKAQPGQPFPACSFTIAGGTPGGKVCWTVQAQRHDRFVQTYGAPVETPKEGRELGAYQQPELYGQPAPARH